MRFYSETLSLKLDVFMLLRDLIHERTGLYYDERKREALAEKLTPLAMDRGLGSFLDYYYLLKYDLQAEEEWHRVMDALTVGETYFWREMDQVKALVDVVVPEFFRENPSAVLRIWSAACASGEEPLTLAMVLEEAGWFDRASIEINGSDVSPAAIETARRGIYRERSFRSLPFHLRRKYFEESDNRWKVLPGLHSRVSWSVANMLSEDEAGQLASSPVIFCRNAFIYFSENSIKKAVCLFYKNMPDPGYLFVGASESLIRVTSDFELREIGGAFVYLKRQR
ncbi:MAG: CheR family methyltransferase [Acidobacteriota bacterium]